MIEVRLMPILGSDMKVRRLRISVPLVEALLDEPGGRYMREEDLPPKAGAELRAHRAPSLKSLVKLALKCESAEQMGEEAQAAFRKPSSSGMVAAGSLTTQRSTSGSTSCSPNSPHFTRSILNVNMCNSDSVSIHRTRRISRCVLPSFQRSLPLDIFQQFLIGLRDLYVSAT
jgi:hypothetical protein